MGRRTCCRTSPRSATTRPTCSNKVNFLLDATLGLINLEQNQIIKIFSIAAVCLCRRR